MLKTECSTVAYNARIYETFLLYNGGPSSPYLSYFQGWMYRDFKLSLAICTRLLIRVCTKLLFEW